MRSVLKEFGLKDEKIDQIIDRCRKDLHTRLTTEPMPIQDIIEVAKFLVEPTIQYSKYSPGSPKVGGPIDIAAITKHENFKWIQKKCPYEQPR